MGSGQESAHLSMTDIDEPPPKTSHPPLTDLIGLDPNLTGGMDVKEYISRLWSGDWDCPEDAVYDDD